MGKKARLNRAKRQPFTAWGTPSSAYVVDGNGRPFIVFGSSMTTFEPQPVDRVPEEAIEALDSIDFEKRAVEAARKNADADASLPYERNRK